MKNKNTYKEKNIAKMCDGSLCAKCCGDSRYMDLNDINSWGDHYCGKKRKYFPASEPACREEDFFRY